MGRPLEQVKQRAIQHWFEDGLSEICIGVYFVSIGVLFLLQTWPEPGSWLAGLLGLGTLVVVGLGVWLVRPLIRVLKERLAYPRTGYVAYHPPARLHRALSLFLGALMAAFFGWFILNYSQTTSAWLPVLEALALAVPAFVIGQRAGLIRFYLYALITIVISAGLSLSGTGDLVGTAWVFIAAGLVMAFSGLVVFILYLRNVRPPQEAPDGD